MSCDKSLAYFFNRFFCVFDLQNRLFMYNLIPHGLSTIRDRDLRNFRRLNMSDFFKKCLFSVAYGILLGPNVFLTLGLL